MCIFCNIVNKAANATVLYEDEYIMAFKDINPVSSIHFLIIPKQHIASLDEANVTHEAVLGKMLLLAPKLAKQQGMSGFRTMINTGIDGGQEIYHIHLHIFGLQRT